MGPQRITEIFPTPAELARKTAELIVEKINAALDEKDLAIKEAERAITLLPSAKDAVDGPGGEENLALVQAMFGERTRAISTLKRLLQTPCQSQLYGPAPLTAAFLRLDPLWDDLRGDPAFEELCEQKRL